MEAMDVFEATNKDDKTECVHKQVKRVVSSSPVAFNGQNLLLNNTPHCTQPKVKGTELDTSLSSEALLLSQWNLPSKVLDCYATLGIKSMFPWQAECLVLPGVLERKSNLVYSAPTSAGKTLVAELLAIKCIFETKKKVLFILPFVSVTHEKEMYLKQLLGPVGVKIGGFHGGRSPPGGLSAVDLALCTIEKANSLVNHLMEEDKLSTVAGIIVDELHMIGDPHRGYLLELLLTKILYVQSCAGKVDKISGNCDINEPQMLSTKSVLAVQIIGMSATLPNLSCVAQWLKAQLYCTDYRPVPLVEMLKVGPCLYKVVPDNSGSFTMSKVKEYENSFENGHDEEVSLLCWESIKEGHSVLIFCPTKSRCESLALLMIKHLKPLISEQSNTDHPITSPGELIGICEQLRRTSVGLDSVLERTVPHGVGFHHAGLTFDEREIVEGAFRLGKLKVLVATSTLSSGVNLPARRVIIRTPIFHGSVLDVQVYKQMVGRAGRKGVDTLGESVLICKPSEKQKAVKLVLGSLKPIRSCLGGVSAKSKSKNSWQHVPPALKRAVLEVIASGTATRTSDVLHYISSTLLFAELSATSSESNDGRLQSLAEDTIAFLLENDFIGQRETDKTGNGLLYRTQLGIATVASSLGPDHSLVVFSELQAAQRGFVLENELHIIYQVTPISINEQWPNTDWYLYLRMWEGFPPGMKHVAEMIGISESFLVRAAGGRVSTYTSAQQRAVMIHRRFFAALALQDLVKEVPIATVALKYGISKGLVQSLQTSAGMFAGMVTVFCEKLGWNNLELLLSQFQGRLTFGVERELTDLVRISLLNGQRARSLYNAGYHTLVSLATANPFAIETILRNAVPFKSYKLGQEEERDRGVISVNWCPTLRRGLNESEAAAMIVEEAKHLLSEDFNLPVSAWKEAGEYLNRIEPCTTSKLQKSPSSNQKNAPFNALTLPGKNSVDEKGPVESNSLHLTLGTETSLSEKVIHKSGTHHVGLPKKPKFAPKACVKGGSEDIPVLESPQSHVHTPSLPLSSPHIPHSVFTRKASTPVTDKKAEGSSSSFIRNAVTDTNCSHSQCLVSPITVPSKACSSDSCATNQHRTTLNDEKLECDVSGEHSSMDFSLNLSPKSLSIMDAVCKEVVGGRMELATNTTGLRSTSSVSMIAESPMQSDQVGYSMSWSEVCKDVKFSSLEADDDLQVIPSTPPQTREACVSSTTSRKWSPSAGVNFTEDSDHVLIVPNSPVDMSCSLHNLSALHATQDDESGLTVIDVAADVQLFRTFIKECTDQKYISISVAKQPLLGEVGMGFGLPHPSAHGLPIPTWNEEVVGLAICWGGCDVYYVPLVTASEEEGEISSRLSVEERVASVKIVLTSRRCKQQKLAVLGAKRQIKDLAASCNFFPIGLICDPLVADWLLDPDAKEKTLSKMVLHYLPDSPHFLQTGSDENETPLATLATHGPTPKLRSVAECVLTLKLMQQLDSQLEAEDLAAPFTHVEMPVQMVLARMELAGVGFSEENCRDVETVLKTRMLEIEKQCYNLASHPFSLSSPDDVAHVLFIELRLPSGSNPDNNAQGAPTTRGRKRGKGGRRRQLQHLSTAKDVLEKITQLHPLPGLVLEWRRISNTLSKVVYPLGKESVWHSEMSSLRIHYTCLIHTSTGRINVSDPNLQNVPKAYVICEESTPSAKAVCSVDDCTDEDDSVVCESQVLANAELQTGSKQNTPVTVCMRSAFVASKGRVLLGADYSQLELRILAHLSGDQHLRAILNSDGDVFKMIGAKWLNTTPENISPSQRQQAKSICYGMVYGIGPKALAEQLKVDTEEAAQFMESFKSQFPRVQAFIQATINRCSTHGFITTLAGRKRHLPGIHSTNVQVRSQSERQAVNSTIQGSAADIVKQAMISIDCNLVLFKHSRNPADRNESVFTVLCTSPGIMVLQIHDELLFEVKEECLVQVASLVQREMESAIKLSVKLPVKLQFGASWGTLSEFKM
jgi:DNA polymerase theta